MLLIVIICLGIQSAYYLLVFSRLAFYKVNKGSKGEEKVTIIICYKNEEEIIDQTLPSILLQRFDELILVNDNSVDHTLDKLNKYKGDRIKVVSNLQPSGGKKQALLSGILASSNNTILLTDADCTPSSHEWVSKMSHQKLPFVLGYGPMKKVKGLIGLFSRFETYMTALQYLSYALSGIPYMGVGRNLKIHKSTVLAHRDKILGTHLASGDDDLMINSLSTKENTTICIEPESFVYSNPKRSIHAFLKQKTRHISTSPFYKKTHKLLLSVFSGTQILFYMVLIIGMITGTINIRMGFVLIMTKWTIQQIVNYSVMRKLKEADLFWKFPLLDIMFFVYLLILPFYYLFNKNNSTWN